MKPKLKKTLTRQLPFYARNSERALWRHFTKRNKKIRLKKYPLLACVPTDTIGEYIAFHGLYEEELLCCLFEKVFDSKYLQQFKQQQVIDVGANIGNHALFFARFFKQVIAFEPNPSALKLLDTNIFLNKTKNIHVIPIGLSNEAAVLSFVEDPKNLGASGFNVEKPSFSTPIQQLSVEKGDVLLKNKQSLPIALIKLDIEGHELNALQGLKETINQYQPIILFEALTSEGKNGSKAVFKFLAQHHYAYFYTIEQKKSSFFLMRFLQKLKGYELILKQITEPEDRYYSLIIATTNPLQ